ncbi:EKC/KEOPS complex subunit TP53RK [Phymastichus coffea]|uniref:EKC/KEOPS complex subunit TP53RK n=1 Tax=Phymastichus coffea TaxID=108790 RepID=UPI00273B2ECE|nr:EKC/KEOPS complex subunit TP53RK [Phymastichus coffea]XP_058810224.1 EKC/KEOPS complex subunit TP53RK [Phymastichus coffea]XP_058810225.1 EKC/KEOPS complex subunit TP53RK [Phymastichus coffea]
MVYKLPESELIAQGAEARLYKGVYLGKLTLIKERFEKKYRHSDLDARLTKERIKAEARAIVRAKSAGVGTPALYLVDYNRRSIFMQFIENAVTLKTFIDQYVTGKTDVNNLIDSITSALGQTITKLHTKNIVHGDLTTSNILFKNPEDKVNIKSGADFVDKLIVIDFGLAKVDATAEDAAVDLYVLERSLTSAHAQLPELFNLIYKSYQKFFKNNSRLKEIIIKYEDVKARGRKRTMVG